MIANLKYIRRTFFRQEEVFDCGVAALRSLLRYHQSEVPLEQLRILSGTNNSGTTMLGLLQAANYCGLIAEGNRIDIAWVSKLQNPIIIHTEKDNGETHYVIYYGIESDHSPMHIIGDPAEGIVKWSTEELEHKWKSKAALLFNPGPDLLARSRYKKQRKNWLISTLREQCNLLISILLLSSLITVLGFSITLFLQKLVDEMLPKHKLVLIGYGLILLLLVLAIRSFLSYVRNQLLNRYGMDFQERFTGRLFTVFIQKSSSFFLQFSTGEIVSRLSDAVKIQKAIVYVSAVSFIDFLFVCGALTYIFCLSAPLGLIALLIIPFITLLAFYYGRPLYRGNQNVINAFSHTENRFIEYVQGVPVIKDSRKEDYFANKLNDSLHLFLSEGYKLNRVANSFQIKSDLINSIFYMAVLAEAAYQVYLNTLTMGELIAIFSVQASLVITIQRLAHSVFIFMEGWAAADKVYSLISAQGTHAQATAVTQGEVLSEVEVKQLKFRFPGRRPVFSNISFSARKNHILGIAGKNGSGKSLLLQLLMGNFPPESGTITFTLDKMKYSLALDWQRFIGHVPQQVFVFSGTIIENICLSDLPEDMAKVMPLCSDIGIHSLITALPQSYNTVVGQNHFHLSGGQLQMIGFARALFRNPTLLLLDESTNAMDAGLAEIMTKYILKSKADMAVIWISHDLDILNQCDSIYHMPAN